jgi:hypothetical protein
MDAHGVALDGDVALLVLEPAEGLGRSREPAVVLIEAPVGLGGRGGRSLEL